MESIEIVLNGESLRANADGSLFWPERRLLFIADFHLGKVNHFRKSGIAVPLEIQQHNFERLERCIAATNPLAIYFLGDLFHSEMNVSWQLLKEHISGNQQIEYHLISGNHDILPTEVYDDASLILHPEGLVVEPFVLNHHPLDTPDLLFSLCGHIHPAVRMRGRGRQSVRLNCFWKSAFQLVLPAYGGFTGSKAVRPGKKDEIYVIVENTIRRV